MGWTSFLPANRQCQSTDLSQWPDLILSSSTTGLLIQGALLPLRPLSNDSTTSLWITEAGFCRPCTFPSDRQTFNLFFRMILVSWHQKGQTHLDFNEATDDGVGLASAGPYANHLHFTTCQHLITHFLQAGCSSNCIKALKARRDTFPSAKEVQSTDTTTENPPLASSTKCRLSNASANSHISIY